MCKSVRGLVLGCLAFSVTYILAGCVQIGVGVVFMVGLPIFRLASNIWTGILNIILGGAVTMLICCGQPSMTKHRLCLSSSAAVVVVNLCNLLVLEICEWRAFLPPARVQDIIRDQKTDLLLVAYLCSTISTAVALVVGFVACEYIYCLLIAASPDDGHEAKADTRRRSFPKRRRRASWYEPISFSWVFEAPDEFYSGSSSLPTYRTRGLGPHRPINGDRGLANKTFIVSDSSIDGKSAATTALAADTVSGITTLLPMKHAGVTASSIQGNPNLSRSSQHVARIGGGDSKSSSGYSSPADWLALQTQHRSQNLNDGGGGHYENAPCIQCVRRSQDHSLSHPNVVASQDNLARCSRSTRSVQACGYGDRDRDRKTIYATPAKVAKTGGGRKRSLSDRSAEPIYYRHFGGNGQRSRSGSSPKKSPVGRKRRNRAHSDSRDDSSKTKPDGATRGEGMRSEGCLNRKREDRSHKADEDDLFVDTPAAVLNGNPTWLRSTPEAAPGGRQKRASFEAIEIQHLDKPSDNSYEIHNQILESQNSNAAQHIFNGSNKKHCATTIQRQLMESIFTDVPALTDTNIDSSTVSSKDGDSDSESMVIDVTSGYHPERSLPSTSSPTESTVNVDDDAARQPFPKLSANSFPFGEQAKRPSTSRSASFQNSLTSVTCLDDGVLSSHPPTPTHYSHQRQSFLSSSFSDGESGSVPQEPPLSSSPCPYGSVGPKDATSFEGGVGRMLPSMDDDNDEAPAPLLIKIPTSQFLQRNGIHPVHGVRAVGELENIARGSPSSTGAWNSTAANGGVGKKKQRPDENVDVGKYLLVALSTDPRGLSTDKQSLNTWAPAGSKKMAAWDGISFQSLGKQSGLTAQVFTFLGPQSGNGSGSSLGLESCRQQLWRAHDSPRLDPISPDDADSLINLSTLELMARQWRNRSHQELQ